MEISALGGILHPSLTDLRTVEQSCKAQELSAQEVLETAPPRCKQQDDITTSQDHPRVSRVRRNAPRRNLLSRTGQEKMTEARIFAYCQKLQFWRKQGKH
jgi:hypothetical protein